MLFSVPPSAARRLLLSFAMRASSPSLTKDVFSLIPVNFEALLISSSSIFKVVLMISSNNLNAMMHLLYTYIDAQIKCHRRGDNAVLSRGYDESCVSKDLE